MSPSFLLILLAIEVAALAAALLITLRSTHPPVLR
jgi:hypothetical protein